MPARPPVDRDPPWRSPAGPDAGILSNRAIVSAGCLGGIALAIASMFWAEPERIVQQATGIGTIDLTHDQKVQTLLRSAQYQEVIDLLLQHLRLREHSERRLSLYICALVLSGQDDRAREELAARIGVRAVMAPADAPPEPAFAGPAFLEGVWEIRNDDGSVFDRCTIERLCNGRAYLERRSARRFVGVALYLHDPDRDQWTRTLLTRFGTLAYYRGEFQDGEVRLRGNVSQAPEADASPLQMVFRPCPDGSFEMIHEEQTREGGWRPVRVQTYTPDVSGWEDPEPEPE